MTMEDILEHLHDGQRGYEPEHGVLVVFLYPSKIEKEIAKELGLRTIAVPRSIWSDPEVMYPAIRHAFFAAWLRGETEPEEEIL